MLCVLLIHVTVVLTVTAQKNLTPFGKASQSSQYESAGPQNAINPPISNEWGYTRCTHTSPNLSPAWWMFNISYGTVFITDIKIFYREHFARRMDGFKLYISNASTTPPSYHDICYQDPVPGLPKINQTIPCNHLGQYVIYYDDVPGSGDHGSIIELCYVSINGCQKNFWGSNCTKSCIEQCIDQHCYPGNGSCVWGCNTKNCLNDICNSSTACCTTGCKERRTGNHCNKYNIATDASVSQNPSGTQPANLVKDGDKTTCSKAQGPNVMFQVDLTEIRIVTDIYLTGKENTTMHDQKHTFYASNSSGSPEKGTLLYQVDSLTQHISINAVFRYLTFVPAMNSSFIELEICEIGIVGCPAAQYGPVCNKTCPTQCRGPCDLETGNCIIGCLNGWIGEKCDKACDFGYYGSECQELCSVNCINASCYHTNGECNSGCYSGWTGINCTQVRSELHEESNEAAIGGSIGALLAIILIILAVLFIYKRNSKSTKDKYSDKSKSSRKNIFNSKRETNDRNEYVNAAITSDLGEVTVYLKDTEHAELQSESDDTVYKNLPTEHSVYKIPIGNLKEVINEKLKDEGFRKEYEILPKGLVHAHVEGSKEENKVKNRFLTTWPYDHSRIVLKGNTRTDYINACYIDNYDKENAYIAAQGPKKNTVRDFWHMIWQENVGKIVMVTQLKEGKRDKCIQYWPDAVNEPMVVDNYRLTMTKEKEHTFYVYRLITIFNNTVTKQKERKVHQFHFIQWPDHGVPDSIKLVHFYRKVKSEHCDQNGPMVVHCSAGVGRTGTFIAIDALYEHGKKVNYVDIMEYVQMMRKDRMNMIQTHEQYETVFEALLELFTIPETTIPKNDFCKYIEDQECKRLPKNQKVYKREFQTLENLRPLYIASNFTAANLKENISKNSVKNILPHDSFRPYLMSYGRTRNDYINAVMIPGYREESQFFVTQCPMKDTVVDFWTMIYDHNSRIIVLLDQVNKNAKLWLGRSEMLVVEDFSILQEEEHHMDELKIALDYKKQQDKRIINVFTTSDWQGSTLPSTKLMVDLLKGVVNCWNSQKCPITVVCRDGCTKGGLFVALYLILDKMEIDEEVDIFQVVRNIQTRRPEFLKNCITSSDCTKASGCSSMLSGIIIHTIVLLTVTAQKNLTPFGRATQSSQSGEGGPRNAILPPISNEWGYDKCTHTDPYKSPAWWMFNISFGPAFITDIKIYYREQFNERMDGFKLYISNSSKIPPSDYLCYKDSAEGFPEVTETVPCNQIGQYIIYYDDKVGNGDFGNVIELCYVAINGCQKNFWGKNCEHACTENCIGQQCYPGNGFCVWGCNAEHCLNDICDKNTAVCTNGCKERRTGRFCNMYNIATDASVSQNPTGSQPANLANDGDKTSCSKTQGTNVRFHIDMKEIRIVTEIYLTVKVNSTMEGVHTIYASNSSVFPDKAIVLYQGESLPTAIGVHAVFRYLTYVPAFNSAVLGMEICEIGIVGCQSSQYGLLCNKICPAKCRGPCDLETGFCIFGCLGGWVGKKCEQACSFGYYGNCCNEQCSVTCMNPRCSHITGECIGGCKTGWKGFNCTQECSNGYFGENCTEFCGGCLSNSCDHLDGLCKVTTACSPGYVHEDYCNQKCRHGYFGGNCTDYCWGCLSNLCDPLDGLCKITTACNRGYVYGDYCNQKCSSGHFGENCTDYCWGCLSNLCDPLDGLCNITTACSPGYLDGEYCNQTCNYGFYGNGCIEKCSLNCHMPHCNHITGECVGGCKNGWMGFNCTEVCDDWYFGNNCSSRCNCLIKPCDKFTGRCPKGGCQTEWHGESCNQVRSKKVINWLAIGGGVAGLIVMVLILLGVCFIYKRKAISTEDRNQATNTEYIDATWDKEETELPSAREHCVHSYNNIPTEDTSCNYKISIENLKQVTNEKQKDCGFQKEFESLPKELVHPSVEGSREENKVKNRFLTTLPYDHSRIVLKGNTDHDYINASYIDNYDKERAYIAAQGPKRNIVRDFWHMVWQENVRTIVMVTQLEEGRKEKCAKYWPESVNKPLVVDSYRLIMTEEKQHTHYMYRKITVLNSSSMVIFIVFLL